jgi:hypothetical protein
MDLKKFNIYLFGLVFFMMTGLLCSTIYAAEQIPKGSLLPDFQLKGTDSPQTKAYLGISNEKQFSLSQIKTKLVLLEFIDVF